MYETSELRKGMKVEIAGEPFLVVEAQFVKPGKGNAFTRCKFKSLSTGLTLERTFRSGEKIDRCQLEERPMDFLYEADGELHFMDTGSFEQVALDREHVAEAANWLTENLAVSMLLHNGKPLSIELPNFVELQIIDTEPGVKGDTKSNAMKPAKMQTGATVMVPLFVDREDWIKIDTRTGTYVERVKR